MKTKQLVPVLLAMTAVLLPCAGAEAFNSATHIYITQRAAPQYAWSIDAAYGSIAPDVDQYVTDSSNWPTAYEDTHRDYADLTRYAIGPTQKLFAIGWRLHGESCGADRYAHSVDPFTADDGGYVIAMSSALQQVIPGLPGNVAHFAIEAAVDALLQRDGDRSLAKKVLRADLLRSWEDRNLLTRVLVLRDRRTDFVTLATAEFTFRTLVQRYAAALALPYPQNVDAIAALGAELSQELFGQAATKEEILVILEAAIAVCQDSYGPAVTATIERVAADPACR